MTQKIGTIETYLGTTIVFLGVWLWKDFLGLWLSLVFGAICASVLLIAVVSEWIEPSRVPKAYFKIMTAIIAGIGTASGAYLFLFGGNLNLG